MQQLCKNPWCKAPFDISDADLAILDKVSPVIGGKTIPIPPPTLCPDCRQQRRLSWRNERNLYRNTCGKCNRQIISAYSRENPHVIYCHDCWWGNNWDAKSFGRNVDLERSVFEQINEVILRTPHLALINSQSENAEFTHCASHNKDCYMCFAAVYNERSLYLNNSHKNIDCTDCLATHSGELCYECVNCQRCHTCSFAQDCTSCSSCTYIFDCLNCMDCTCCTGLRNKRYCFENTQLSKDEYIEKISSSNSRSHQTIEQYLSILNEKKPKHPRKFCHEEYTEASSGDYLSHTKQCHSCFDVINGEEGMHLFNAYDFKTCMDSTYIDSDSELLYETLSVAAKRSIGNAFVWFAHDCYYSFNCHHSNNLFGCSQLQNERYCIFNRQYSKEEYERILPTLIERMRKDGEWGEFFPTTMSPFGYNETVAHEYFPLREEEVRSRRWKWRDQKDEIPKVNRTIPATQLPDSIDEIPDDILNWAIECDATKRPFKIIKQELEFYRSMKLPIPRFHPDERHRRRMTLRNPRKLWKRNCQQCGKEIMTSFGPERTEIVYCEECHLKEVY